MERLFAACQEAGIPAPNLRYEPNDLWLEFQFSADYLDAIGQENKGIASGKMSEKMSEKILAEIRKRRNITIAELSKATGVTTRTVERNLKKLQEAGRLKRAGPDKGGQWVVKKQT